MEGDNANNNGPAGSRWNPTKEQIGMLETLYMQGLRTPSAEQIQQITNRLRAFGHIEGKNVFYWFQNHKARQRQKQKQDSMASFNRFLHKNSAFPPYFNVVCSTCYVQPTVPHHADMGLYHQYTKIPPHGGFRRRQIPESQDKNKQSTCQKYNKIMNPTHRSINQECTQQTLDLFPIHPTGILQGKTCVSTNEQDSNSSSSYENDCLPRNEGGNCGQNFFDFFCGNGSSESQ